MLFVVGSMKRSDIRRKFEARQTLSRGANLVLTVGRRQRILISRRPMDVKALMLQSAALTTIRGAPNAHP
jgi:transcription termination factor Rho